MSLLNDLIVLVSDLATATGNYLQERGFKVGGTTGQVPVKSSSDDFDWQWGDLIGDTAPVNDAFATALLDPTGANNAILLTATPAGELGNVLSADITIDSSGIRTGLELLESASELTIICGDKRRMIISGATTPDVNGACTYVGTDEAYEAWTSNGLPYEENYTVNAFTEIEHHPTVESMIRRYDAAGNVVYQAAFVGGGPGGVFPSDHAYAPPTVGTGTPSVASSTASAAQAITIINANSTLAGAANNSGNDGTGALAAATANFSGGGNTPAPPYFRVAGGLLYVQEGGEWKSATLSSL